MSKKISFILACIVSMAFSPEEAKSWDPPLEIDVVAIQFNFEAGNTDDALYIIKNSSENIDCPEWYPSLSRNNPFAYIKSQTNRHFYVTFEHNQGQGEICSMRVYTTGSGYYPGLVANSAYVSFPSCGDNTSVELTMTGSVSNSVQSWGFHLNWYVTMINGLTQSPYYSMGTTGEHDYYILLATPQSPMGEPWTDVLDYSCVWAANQSTASNVAHVITEGIYYMGDTDGDIDYDWPLRRCIYSLGRDNRIFKLSDFLSDINTLDTVTVNCSDVGNLFNIFSAAVGLSSYSKRIWKSTSPYIFLTELVDPIGSPEWATATWGYHQYGWYNSSVDDPCLRVDYDSPILPSNMEQGMYAIYLISPGYSYNGSDIGTASLQ